MKANIWTVEFEENWSYDEKGEYHDDGMSFNVSAENSDEAIAKAKKLARVGRKFKDDESGMVHTLKDVRLIGVSRGQMIDG